jgi:hypothetical protein
MAVIGSWIPHVIWKKILKNVKTTQIMGIFALFLVILLMMNISLLKTKTELISLLNLGLIGCLVTLIIGYIIIKMYKKRSK